MHFLEALLKLRDLNSDHVMVGDKYTSPLTTHFCINMHGELEGHYRDDMLLTHISDRQVKWKIINLKEEEEKQNATTFRHIGIGEVFKRVEGRHKYIKVCHEGKERQITQTGANFNCMCMTNAGLCQLVGSEAVIPISD